MVSNCLSAVIFPTFLANGPYRKEAINMKIKLLSIRYLFAAALVGALASQVMAQDVLPYPEQPFKGKIGRTAKESTPDFPEAVTAPKGAPNVLLIMTDDVGFGAGSTFGGPIPTSSMDQLAKSGLRYNMFHTTALCSPTRAAPSSAGEGRPSSRGAGRS